MSRSHALAAVALALSVALLPVTAHAAEPRLAVAHPAALPAGARILPGATRTPVAFDIVLAQPRAAALRRFLADLSDPASPSYRHFLTTAQFAARFGAPAREVDALRGYFSSYGVHVGSLSRGRIVLHLSGATAAIARAFAAPVATVRLEGRRASQFTATATLPAAIAHDVAAVDGLSTVAVPHAVGLAHPVASARAHATGATTCAAATGGSAPGSTTPNTLGGYSLQQQGALYGLASAWSQGITGAGQTIAVYELGSYSPSNVATYLACYGLTTSVHNVPVDGGGPSSYSDEATLDVEEAAGLAPGATVDVYTGPNNANGPLDIYQAIADANTASVVTTSWGTCEQDPSGDPAAEQAVFEQMAAQGQTVVAAAGDNGSSDCAGITTNAPAVDDPASQPFVTGVGGLTVTSISPLTESVWNDGTGSGGGAGGGGISTLWSRPSWQVAPGIPTTATMRLVPDLSVMADPSTGFIQYFTGSGATNCGQNCGAGWSSIGGTSIGAPLVAALVAVGAQSCGVTRLGFLNPTLYAMASTGFNDVTSGNNDLFGVGVYSAGPGYDMASGLGSPNPATFLAGLCPPSVDLAASTVTVTPSVVATSAPVTVAVALRRQGGSPEANASVQFTARANQGLVLFDAARSSAISTGRASFAATTDANGNVTVTVLDTLPGPLTITVTYQAQVLATRTVRVGPPPRSAPAALVAPRIVRASPARGGAVLQVRWPSTTSAARLQVSVDGGRSWVTVTARGPRVVLTGLRAGATYRVRVRYLVAGRVSPSSAPVALRVP